MRFQLDRRRATASWLFYLDPYGSCLCLLFRTDSQHLDDFLHSWKRFPNILCDLCAIFHFATSSVWTITQLLRSESLHVQRLVLSIERLHRAPMSIHLGVICDRGCPLIEVDAQQACHLFKRDDTLALNATVGRPHEHVLWHAM